MDRLKIKREPISFAWTKFPVVMSPFQFPKSGKSIKKLVRNFDMQLLWDTNMIWYIVREILYVAAWRKSIKRFFWFGFHRNLVFSDLDERAKWGSYTSKFREYTVAFDKTPWPDRQSYRVLFESFSVYCGGGPKICFSKFTQFRLPLRKKLRNEWM